jgi:hypothetical protein
MNCEKYRYKAEVQKNTWLPMINIPYFHVIGKEDLESPYRFEGKTLYVRTPDDYCSLPKKVISAYEAIHKTYEYKYIFKTDDDQMLRDPSFFSRLTHQLSCQKGVDYGGRMCHITEECFSGYWEYHNELPKTIKMYPNKYCNGRFYILSQRAVSSLILYKESISKEYLEDYAIGYFLDPDYKFPIMEIDNNVFVDF